MKSLTLEEIKEILRVEIRKQILWAHHVKEGAQVAWSPHFTIQGENIGFEFTWINMNLDDYNRKAKWDISYSNLALYYQFNFE